jgi:adenylosuccinate lyase
LNGLLADPLLFTGAAREQVAAVVRAVDAVVATDPNAAQYQAEPIL